jgi:hypothetical protein
VVISFCIYHPNMQKYSANKKLAPKARKIEKGKRAD